MHPPPEHTSSPSGRSFPPRSSFRGPEADAKDESDTGHTSPAKHRHEADTRTFLESGLLGRDAQQALVPDDYPESGAASLLADAWARNFHDDTAQYLTALTLGLRSLREPLTEGQRTETLDKLDALAELLRRELYDVVGRLRQFEQAGSLAADFQRIGSIWAAYGTLKVINRFHNLERLTLPPRLRFAIVNIVKEAVTNAAKHTSVRRVKVRASLRRAALKVIVRDRGQGLAASGGSPLPGDRVASGGHGIVGMYENARAVGGELLIRSRPGSGTVVVLEIPISAAVMPGDAQPVRVASGAVMPERMKSGDNAPAERVP